MLKILDFYADWCGPCKIMVPIFTELEKEYNQKVVFERINVDEQQQKAADYGIMSIPTFVLEKDNKEIDRKMGAVGKEVLEEWINKYLF